MCNCQNPSPAVSDGISSPTITQNKAVIVGAIGVALAAGIAGAIVIIKSSKSKKRK